MVALDVITRTSNSRAASTFHTEVKPSRPMEGTLSILRASCAKRLSTHLPDMGCCVALGFRV